MKKKTSSEERIEEFGRRDDVFRRLTEVVRRNNGGRIPSSAEIDRRIQAWRDRRASS